MAVELLMPRLSDSMEEATVVRWLKQVGDAVAEGETIAEIDTDKATVSYEADSAGWLLEILVGEGETAALGAPIAVVGRQRPAGDGTKRPAGDGTKRPAGDGTKRPAGNRTERPAGDGMEPLSPDRRLTPVARRVAAELRVDTRAIVGSGPRGRVTKDDVRRAATPTPAPTPTPDSAPTPTPDSAPTPTPDSAPTPTPPSSMVADTDPALSSPPRSDVVVEPLTRLQTTIARRMVEAKTEVPDFTLFVDVDMTGCVDLRERLRALDDRPPSFNDMVVKAAALALRDHPRANGSYRNGGFELHRRINVGVAVAADDALIVPTIFDADRKSLSEIARESRRLAAAVRDRLVTPSELSGATFTVSNLGMFGVSAFTAIVNAPQAGILSVGAIERRAVVVDDGVIVARAVLTLGLACDHRILYGADAARLLARIRQLLQAPLALAL